MKVIIESDDGRKVEFTKSIGMGMGFTEIALMTRLINNQKIIQERIDKTDALQMLFERISKD